MAISGLDGISRWVNGTYKEVYFSKQLVAVWTGCNWFFAGFLFSRMKRQLDNCCLDFHATSGWSGPVAVFFVVLNWTLNH